MSEHPILFSGEMIRALRAGRKTRTRRLSKRWLKVKAGDLLWVRETLRLGRSAKWFYDADSSQVLVSEENETAMVVWAHHKDQDYCPSIHMPRWASRITLRATADARLERLQDITEHEAKWEGIPETGCWQHPHEPDHTCRCYRDGFMRLWDSLHDKPGERWQDDAEVVVISFDVSDRARYEREHGTKD